VKFVKILKEVYPKGVKMSNQKNSKPTARRSIAILSLLGITKLYSKNPFVIACCSMAFPGMGHLLLTKHYRGFILVLLALFINHKAHVNLLILYSFIGDFEKAKAVVDIQWLSLYIPTYFFAIWDSYRTTVDLNQLYKLAAREDSEVIPFRIGALEINYLDKRTPWTSAIWSLFIPGSGHIYFFIRINLIISPNAKPIVIAISPHNKGPQFKTKPYILPNIPKTTARRAGKSNKLNPSEPWIESNNLPCSPLLSIEIAMIFCF